VAGGQGSMVARTGSQLLDGVVLFQLTAIEPNVLARLQRRINASQQLLLIGGETSASSA